MRKQKNQSLVEEVEITQNELWSENWLKNYQNFVGARDIKYKLFTIKTHCWSTKKKICEKNANNIHTQDD